MPEVGDPVTSWYLEQYYTVAGLCCDVPDLQSIILYGGTINLPVEKEEYVRVLGAVARRHRLEKVNEDGNI
jgi:hypothetical protein